MSNITEPDQIKIPGLATSDVSIVIPYIGEEGENELTYVDGEEADVDWYEETDHIEANHKSQVYTYENPGYTLKDVLFDAQGQDATLSVLLGSLSSEEGSSRGIVYCPS